LEPQHRLQRRPPGRRCRPGRGGLPRPAGEGHYYVVLQSLAHTVGVDPSTVRKLDALRKRRHIATYTRAGTVSDREARDAIALIDRVCAEAEAWLKKNHPELLKDRAREPHP
jgi:hypothetical protein